MRRLLSPLSPTPPLVDRLTDKHVLMVIALGLITILLAIIIGLLLTPRALPNWAENIFVAIGTAAVLKLGDCINALVALSTGRSVERLGTQLGNSTPTGDAPMPVKVTNSAATPVPVDNQ